MGDLDWQRCNQIELEWQSIEDSYRLAPYQSPTNLRQERDKLLKAYKSGRAYNPKFEFAVPPEYPIKLIRQFIAGLKPESSWLEQIYYEIANQELQHIQAVQTHDSNLITGITCISYGLPESELVTKAQHILESTKKTNSSQDGNQSLLADHEAASKLQLILDSNNLQDWKAIVFEPMNAKMSVDRLDKQVKIRAGTTFSEQTVQRLIVHELGVHVVRYHNGSHQPIKLFQKGFPNYLSTEEGLAVYSEDEAGLLETDTLRKYAGRVMAAHLAVNQPFCDVFNTLCHWLDYETAFDIVARAKRGFTDTSQPGAHTKDIVYLQGYLDVKHHLTQYPEDYDLLFIGKFGLQHLPLVRNLLNEGTLFRPILMPDKLMGGYSND
ncbi:MAG: DUF1704 domain-containing protein [Anaerolineaceae bacterium]|nr:DUF1704 domain-containing protein [Anaerolineaceae bacterium]